MLWFIGSFWFLQCGGQLFHYKAVICVCLSTAECVILSVPGHLVNQRTCAFQLKPQNLKHNEKYVEAGPVDGSVQRCARSQWCVGYFLLVNNRPQVDLLGELHSQQKGSCYVLTVLLL